VTARTLLPGERIEIHTAVTCRIGVRDDASGLEVVFVAVAGSDPVVVAGNAGVTITILDTYEQPPTLVRDDDGKAGDV